MNENANNFLAAELALPWHNSGVASIRKSFQLPTDRPMRG
jgi:hypothetical protein